MSKPAASWPIWQLVICLLPASQAAGGGLAHQRSSYSSRCRAQAVELAAQRDQGDVGAAALRTAGRTNPAESRPCPAGAAASFTAGRAGFQRRGGAAAVAYLEGVGEDQHSCLPRRSVSRHGVFFAALRPAEQVLRPPFAFVRTLIVLAASHGRCISVGCTGGRARLVQ